MRLGRAHETGFAAAMMAAMMNVLAGGSFPVVWWLALLAPAISAVLVTRNVHVPGISGTAIGIVAVGAGITAMIRSGLDVAVLAGGEALLGLLVGRLLVRRTAAHDMQAIALSMLLVLAGSVLNVGINYGVSFIGYAVCVIWALSTRHLLAGARADDVERARARRDVVTPFFFAATGLVALVVLLSAAVLFAVFPRVGFGDIGGLFTRQTRLPNTVSLRGDPALGGGSTDVVARVRGVSREAFERGLYMRGAVYNVLAVDGFSQSAESARPRRNAIPVVAPTWGSYDVTLLPVVGDRLLLLGGTSWVRVVGGGAANPNRTLGVQGRNSHDEMRTEGELASALRYTVSGGIAAPGFIPTENATQPPTPPTGDMLALPAALEESARNLARGIVGDASAPADKARLLRAFFADNFTYSLSPPRLAASPVYAFLFEQRQGHCEMFAAAYALLLRASGVPARVVGGFQGGAWDDGIVVFQTRNAHAWVEWWQEGKGWVVDDATPLRTAPRTELVGVASFMERVRRFWDDSIIDYAFSDQVDALSRLRRVPVEGAGTAIGVGVGAVVVAAVLVNWLRRRRRATVVADVLGVALVQAVERARGHAVDDSATVREAVCTLPVQHALRAHLDEPLLLYERARFGGQPLTRSALRAALRTVARAPRGTTRS